MLENACKCLNKAGCRSYFIFSFSFGFTQLDYLFYVLMTAYCVVAVQSVGRQIPMAFLERIKEDFTKKYSGGKAATAVADSLNREFG